MKKFAIIIGTMSFCALLVTAWKIEADKTAAKVSQLQGLSIFILSTPAATYDYLGSETKKISITGEPGEMLNSMIKKIKKNYPTADGVIFTDVAMKKGDAIKFK